MLLVWLLLRESARFAAACGRVTVDQGVYGLAIDISVVGCNLRAA